MVSLSFFFILLDPDTRSYSTVVFFDLRGNGMLFLLLIFALSNDSIKINSFNDPTATVDEVIAKFALYFLYIGIAAFGLSYMEVLLKFCNREDLSTFFLQRWRFGPLLVRDSRGKFERRIFGFEFWGLSNDTHRNFQKAILSQDIGWFDTTKTTELTSRIAGDTVKMQEAISEKVGNYMHFMVSLFKVSLSADQLPFYQGTFLAGFIMGDNGNLSLLF